RLVSVSPPGPQSPTSVFWVAELTTTVTEAPCAMSPKVQLSVCGRGGAALTVQLPCAGPELRNHVRLLFGSGSVSTGLNRTFVAVPGPRLVTTIVKLIVSPAWNVPASRVFWIVSTGCVMLTGLAPYSLLAEVLFASPG